MQVDYTLAGARALLEHLAPKLPEGKKFRFVFCSGKFAEWDQNKTLHFMADTRHVKVRSTIPTFTNNLLATQSNALPGPSRAVPLRARRRRPDEAL